jgi:hypothetical protein
MEEIYREITSKLMLYFNYWIETESAIEKTYWCTKRLGGVQYSAGAKAEVASKAKWTFTGAPDYNKTRYYFVDVSDYTEFMLRFG